MNNRRLCHYGMILAVSLAMMLFIMISAQGVYALSDPVKNDKGITTWDCVYFGHYPQGSDGNGGFITEPIKWRVLKVSGDGALIFADKNIDTMPYCANSEDCLWHVSTIRSWLNGYGADTNQQKIDYSEDNFISRAFTAEELEAVKTTDLITDKYTDWHFNWTDIHHYYMETSDKVFLLSFDDYTNVEYGFTDDDEPTVTREALNTAYSAAGGTSRDPYRSKEGVKDSWILRTPGEYSMYADMITRDGEYKEDTSDTNMVKTCQGIRPVLHLDLSKTGVWEDAGTYTARFPQMVKVTSNYQKKTGDSAFDLGASCTGDSVLEYKSDNEVAASVDETGRVTINGAGKAVITVTAPMTDTYEKAEATVTVNVTKRDPEIKVASDSITISLGDKPKAIGAEAGSALTYKSDNDEIAVVDESGNVTAKGTGSCKITITAAETDIYKEAVKEITVTVEKKAAVITASKTVFNLKAAKLKKKAQTVKFTAKASSGAKLTYSGKASGKSKKALKINGKTGKITVKKGTKKGKYVMTVTVKAASTDTFKAASKKVKVTVKVK